MASAAGSAPVPTGCYKCGRPGHWSRDCPANPGGSAGPGASAGGPPSTTTTTGGFGFGRGNSWTDKGGDGRKYSQTSQAGSQYSKGAPKETAPKEPKKRPKLTADLLLSEGGLGYVLEKMPEMVNIQGREDTVVRDLKSLLEGYMHWHSLLLPYFSFDQFVEKAEKLGSTKRVRMCVRELRDKIVYGKGSKEDKEVDSEAVGGGSPSEHAAAKDTSVGPQTEPDHGTSPDHFFTAEEPALPVNEEDFEDFFRQGIVEPEDTVPSSTVTDCDAPGRSSDASSPVRKFPPSASGGDSAPQSAAKSTTISESAAARMEANRLRALERARARRESNAHPQEQVVVSR